MPRGDDFPFASPPSRRGGAGNVLAAIGSAIIPGLGQLAQGRLGPALFFLLAALLLWAIMTPLCLECVPIAIHVWAALDAALWEPS